MHLLARARSSIAKAARAFASVCTPARVLLASSILLVSVGVGAFDWRLGLLAAGGLMWWDLHS